MVRGGWQGCCVRHVGVLRQRVCVWGGGVAVPACVRVCDVGAMYVCLTGPRVSLFLTIVRLHEWQTHSGCDVPDTDTDSDSVMDCNDACASDPAKIAPGTW